MKTKFVIVVCPESNAKFDLGIDILFQLLVVTHSSNSSSQLRCSLYLGPTCIISSVKPQDSFPMKVVPYLPEDCADRPLSLNDCK